MKTIPCPTCSHTHELFYTVGKGGSRNLNYICDKQKHYWFEDWDGKTHECWKYVTKIMHLPFEEIPGLPEKPTPGRKSELQKKDQMQLVLMTSRKEKKP